VVTPARGVWAVDGLLTGFHEPRSSHLLMLGAVVGQAHLQAAYAEALRAGYLWHEFGDLHLVLPGAPSQRGNRPRQAAYLIYRPPSTPEARDPAQLAHGSGKLTTSIRR
jgi:hypothetical protein